MQGMLPGSVALKINEKKQQQKGKMKSKESKWRRRWRWPTQSVAKNAHVKSACKNVDNGGRCCPFTHTHTRTNTDTCMGRIEIEQLLVFLFIILFLLFCFCTVGGNFFRVHTKETVEFFFGLGPVCRSKGKTSFHLRVVNLIERSESTPVCSAVF